MLSGMRTIGLTVSGDGVNTATVDMDSPPIFGLVTVSISRFSASTDDGLVVMRAGIMKRAIEMARSQKNYRKPLAVLHADWDAFSEAMEYKIDIRTGKIVRKPLVSIPTDDRPKGQKKRAGKRSR